jgi:arylformamidase
VFSQVHDITLPLDEETIRYPGDAPPALRMMSTLSRGDALSTSEISLPLHVGTHVDAPAHFVPEGARIGDLALDRFVGRAIVVFTDSSPVDGGDIPARHGTATHLLMRTRNASLLGGGSFVEDYVHFTAAAARRIVEEGWSSLGIDYYSVDAFHDSALTAHRILAHAGIPVYVCLDLRHVAEGEYHLVAPPLRLTRAEASPVRALLFR